MDNCGIGGDKFFSFNIFIIAVFVLVGGGVYMVKYGNCLIFFKLGFVDVLEVLSINFDFKLVELGKVFDKIGIVFFFVKNMYLVMKYIMLVCLELGILMIMNLIGFLIYLMVLEI